MSTIKAICTEAPNFPATDRHADAVRYRVGKYIVDALDGEPTQQEIDAVLTPTPSPGPADSPIARALIKKGIITKEDIQDAASVIELDGARV